MINVAALISIFWSDNHYLRNLVIIPFTFRLIKITYAFNKACLNLKIGLNLLDIINHAELKLVRIVLCILMIFLISILILLNFTNWDNNEEQDPFDQSNFNIIVNAISKVQKGIAWQNFEEFFDTNYGNFSLLEKFFIYIFYIFTFFLIRIIGMRSIFGLMIFSIFILLKY